MQMRFFRIGCYLAFLTAILHLVGAHLVPQPPPPDDTGRQMQQLMETYKLGLPGAADRTMAELVNGFSLLMSLHYALTGGLGLIVARRAAGDPLLMAAAARALAGAYVIALVISLSYFFIIPTICSGAVALCFVIASVRAPTA
jgi:hypothetical protein